MGQTLGQSVHKCTRGCGIGAKWRGLRLGTGRFGHLAGDRVLRDVAHILRSAVRSRDCVIRWGGEEFLVLLEHCEQAPGVLLAERIRHRVEAHHDADVGKVTLSLGLATLSLRHRRR